MRRPRGAGIITLAAALPTLSGGVQTPNCPIDLDGDGSVTSGDAVLALPDFGPGPKCPPSDEVLQELDRVPYGGGPRSRFENFRGWQMSLVVADGKFCGSFLESSACLGPGRNIPWEQRRLQRLLLRRHPWLPTADCG
jgi:hypothetical protein